MTPDEVSREVRRIEITTRHLVRDIVAGEFSSAFRGRGVEFAEVREYQPGDDIRTIDWNVTARLGAAYVKRYLEERELSVLFVVDMSASGGFGSRLRTKGELGTEVTAVLALAAARNNDRIGALFFTDRIEYHLAPAKGRRHVLRLISDLLAFAPRGTGTDLAAALAELEPTLRRRAIIFVLSDFMATGYEAVLGRLARRHDIVGLQLVDQRERELPAAGMVTLWDPETEVWRRVDTGDPALRAYFARRTEEFDRGLDRTLRERGADLLRLETGRPYAEPFADVFPQTGADAVAVTGGQAVRRSGGQEVILSGAKDQVGGASERRGWLLAVALSALALLVCAASRPLAAQLHGQQWTVTPETEHATVGDTVTLAFRVRLDERDLLFDTVPKPARTLPDWIRVFGVEKLQRQPDRIYVGKAKVAFYRPDGRHCRCSSCRSCGR